MQTPLHPHLQRLDFRITAHRCRLPLIKLYTHTPSTPSRCVTGTPSRYNAQGSTGTGEDLVPDPKYRCCPSDSYLLWFLFRWTRFRTILLRGIGFKTWSAVSGSRNRQDSSYKRTTQFRRRTCRQGNEDYLRFPTESFPAIPPLNSLQSRTAR